MDRLWDWTHDNTRQIGHTTKQDRLDTWQNKTKTGPILYKSMKTHKLYYMALQNPAFWLVNQQSSKNLHPDHVF